MRLLNKDVICKIIMRGAPKTGPLTIPMNTTRRHRTFQGSALTLRSRWRCRRTNKNNQSN